MQLYGVDPKPCAKPSRSSPAKDSPTTSTPTSAARCQPGVPSRVVDLLDHGDAVVPVDVDLGDRRVATGKRFHQLLERARLGAEAPVVQSDIVARAHSVRAVHLAVLLQRQPVSLGVTGNRDVVAAVGTARPPGDQLEL